MCQFLLDQQQTFEKFVNNRLDRMQSCLDDLDASFGDFLESPLRGATHTTNTPHTPSFPPPDNSTKRIPPSTNKDSLDPSTISYLRANSCSRENFATKLVKEIFTADERKCEGCYGEEEARRSQTGLYSVFDI